MSITLTKKSKDELRVILKKEFKGNEYPEELLEDLGITLLELTAIVLKHKINNKKLNESSV